MYKVVHMNDAGTLSYCPAVVSLPMPVHRPTFCASSSTAVVRRRENRLSIVRSSDVTDEVNEV
jgi:hypothetical protein